MQQTFRLSQPTNLQMLNVIKDLVERRTGTVGICITGMVMQTVHRMGVDRKLKEWVEKVALNSIACESWVINNYLYDGLWLFHDYKSNKWDFLEIGIIDSEGFGNAPKYLIVLAFDKKRYKAKEIFRLFKTSIKD